MKNECGSALRKQFLFDPAYLNLNHGSFGATPRYIRDVLRASQDEAEARPDIYIRYEGPKIMDSNREAIATYINVPTDTCVFVPNATTGVNTVLRNLVYKPNDVIIYFATIYGACEKTILYLTESTAAESRKIEYTYPVSDDYLCDAFERTVEGIKGEGKVPRIAIFDTIVALPGVCMPFERLTELCRKHGVLSLVDGAHGVGHIPLDLRKLDPDFFVSNCHKWLYVPRGCAVFYVPQRNQQLMRSTLPTSHHFVPLPVHGQAINNPLPPSAHTPFVTQFGFIGTLDNGPYTCVRAALQFRNTVTFGELVGEEAIYKYNLSQARAAGKLVSEFLGTNVLENEQGTLGNCNFSNVRLPLDYYSLTAGDEATVLEIAQWITTILVKDYNTFVAVIYHGDAWWVRLSAQIYLSLEDWTRCAEFLNEVCERVRKLEWKG